MKAVNSYKPWTSKELNLILELARSGEKTLKEAANIFGRTFTSVRIRMQNVGISASTLEATVNKRDMKERQAIQRMDLYGYSLKVGGRYKVDLKIMGRNEPAEHLTCIKNYREYIRFKNDSGVNICHLKVDLVTNPERIKEV